MEQFNKVHIRGIVGNARIKVIGDTELAHFSVATDRVFKNRSGEAVVDTTWHSVTAFKVTAFKKDRFPDFAGLVKGARVEVKGRLYNNRYTDQEGIERSTVEIIANEITFVE